MHQKNMIFVTIDILKILALSYICNGCLDSIQKAMIFNDVAIVYVKGNAYRITLGIWAKMIQLA